MKTLLAILLAISLAFNAFFVLGYVRARKAPQTAHTLEGRARMMAEKLQLDEKQHAIFEECLAEFTELRQARDSQRQAFLDELLKPAPDQKVLESYSVGPEAVGYRLARLTLMRKFVDMLSPAQREMFVEMIRSRNSSSQAGQEPASQ